MLSLADQAPELCSECRQGILVVDQKGTFCSICHRYNQTLQFEHETRKVPDNYKTNARSMNVSSRERNSKQYMNEFSQKYGVRGQSQIEILVGEVPRYLEDASRCKSYREVCAAIFFYNYRKELKLTIKTYCYDNQVCLKRFSKALMRYVAVKNKSSTDIASQLEQLEENWDDLAEKCQGFLRAVSRELFDFTYTNESRKEQYIEVVMKTIRRLSKASENDSMSQQVSIVVYSALKALNHPISLVKYELICKSQGIAISRKTLREAVQPRRAQKDKTEKKQPNLSDLCVEDSTSSHAF